MTFPGKGIARAENNRYGLFFFKTKITTKN